MKNTKENPKSQRLENQELKILQTKVDKMFSTLQNGSADSHNQLLSQEVQSIAKSATPSAATTSSNLERSKTEGTYVNWCFSERLTMRLMPLSDFKNIMSKLEHLDVTVKTNRTLAMKLIDQFHFEFIPITVTRNRRFPQNGDYCHLSNFEGIYYILKHFEKDRDNVKYNRSKSIVFEKFLRKGNDKGWEVANKYALDNIFKSKTTCLDRYLWSLCLLVNYDKINDFEICNVHVFENKYSLTWKEVD